MDIETAIERLNEYLISLSLPWEQGQPILRAQALEIAEAYGVTRADVLAMYFGMLAERQKQKKRYAKT